VAKQPLKVDTHQANGEISTDGRSVSMPNSVQTPVTAKSVVLRDAPPLASLKTATHRKSESHRVTNKETTDDLLENGTEADRQRLARTKEAEAYKKDLEASHRSHPIGNRVFIAKRRKDDAERSHSTRTEPAIEPQQSIPSTEATVQANNTHIADIPLQANVTQGATYTDLSHLHPDVLAWLQMTGFFDEDYRTKRLDIYNKRRELERQQAQLDEEEMEIEVPRRRASSMVNSQSFPSASMPPPPVPKRNNDSVPSTPALSIGQKPKEMSILRHNSESMLSSPGLSNGHKSQEPMSIKRQRSPSDDQSEKKLRTSEPERSLASRITRRNSSPFYEYESAAPAYRRNSYDNFHGSRDGSPRRYTDYDYDQDNRHDSGRGYDSYYSSSSTGYQIYRGRGGYRGRGRGGYKGRGDSGMIIDPP